MVRLVEVFSISIKNGEFGSLGVPPPISLSLAPNHYHYTKRRPHFLGEWRRR